MYVWLVQGVGGIQELIGCIEPGGAAGPVSIGGAAAPTMIDFRRVRLNPNAD
jgi:hypothetical protein